MEVSASLTFPALGLAFARDDTLPNVDIFADGTVKTKEAQAAPAPAKKGKAAPPTPDATVDLSRALVAVGIDAKSPFAKSITAGDVLVAINDKPTSTISSFADISSLIETEMGGAPDSEGFWKTTHLKIDLLRPSEQQVEVTPAVPQVSKKNRGWFK